MEWGNSGLEVDGNNNRYASTTSDKVNFIEKFNLDTLG